MLNLRKIFSVAMLALGMVTTISAQETRTFQFGHDGKNGISMVEQTRGSVGIEFNIDEMSLRSFTYSGEEMQSIGISGIALPNDKGLPNVPIFSRIIAIPQGAEAVLHVVSYEQQVISDVNVEPSLGTQAENEEPDMNYTKDMKVYSQDAFYPKDIASLSEPTTMRGVDIVAFNINPVRFNPVTKEAIVYHNIEMEIEFVGGNGQFGDNRLRSPYFDPILAQNIMNYSTLPVVDYEARMQEWVRNNSHGSEYIIVTPNNDAWAEPAERLREYRMQQGILTEVIRLDEMPATTTDEMKAWFHNAYNTWEIAPVAILMFGDYSTDMTQGVPAEIVSHPSNEYCISDNQFADVTGNDYLPDIVFSRLVAADGTEAAMMVDKQIAYEYTNPNMDPSFYSSPITALGWQTERWFQICSEVVGGYMRNHSYTPQRINCIYSGTPGSSWSSNQNTSMVVNYFGPNGLGYIPASPEELGDWNSGSPEQVVEAVNNGVFWLQHRDHGYVEGWGEPGVSNDHVYQLTNADKMPFVMSINCHTGNYSYTGYDGNCFTEMWMRQTYNGHNAGAVGVLSPTEVSYSFVNDAFVWGVYDLFDGDFMPNYGPYQPAGSQTGNWRPAFGNVAGKYFLAQSSWPSNPSSKRITYQMFTAHCDAFLRIFTQVPQTMTVTCQNTLVACHEFQITAPEGATIAITKGEGEDIELLAVATATGDVQNMAVPAQVPSTILNLTVTGQNYLRYESTIEVTPASDPYLIIDSFSFNGEQVNYGEDYNLNMVIANAGLAASSASTAVLSIDSEYVTITDNTADFGSVSANSSINVDNAFSFSVSDEVPNNTNLDFLVTITSGSDIYEYQINIKACAPVLKIGDVLIEEINGNGNGRLDPGETANLIIPINNKGNAESHEVEATISLDDSFLTLLDAPNTTINTISAHNTALVAYQVSVGSAPVGYAVDYSYDVVSGAYADSKELVLKIGLKFESFEQETLNQALWTNNSTIPWTFSTESPYDGSFCMKSGAIGHNAETLLTLNWEVGKDDSISFYYKVSSEADYDKLFFYIDGTKKDEWSGTIDWKRAQYAVTEGTHTFTWRYYKDYSVNSGSDCAWIDYVVLPRENKSGIITFADPAVKALCVANWDTNNDGELSYNEAAAVTDLGEVFTSNHSIQTFDELQYFTGLTTIGEKAFAWCNGLQNITMPTSVTNIGYEAFYDCRNMLSITIPASVTSIGSSALAGCDKMETMIVEPGNTHYDSRDNCNGIIETATNSLLFGCKNTIIPNSVTSIGNSAFFSCQGLTTIVIPNSVTSIGNYAFFNCQGLTTIVIPNSVASIGNGAFDNCQGLTTIEIPNSVTSIGYSAFHRCSGLTTIEIPNSVSWIGDMAFMDCQSLTQIVVAGGNTVYDSRDNCNAIVETETNSLLFGCKNTIIPRSVTSIVYMAFYNCEELTKIVIPNLVSSIGECGFSGCTGLTSITSNAIVPPTLGTDVFEYVNKSIPVYVPAGTVNTYKTASGWSDFTNIQEIGTYWSPISGTENNMIVNGVIVIDGEQQYDPLLEVGAFCGDECRGSSFARYFPPTGEYVAQITVVSNATDGETINFRLYDHEIQAEPDVVCFNTIEFVADGEIGTYGGWYEYVFYGPDNIQNVNLVEGWNWWSTFIEQNGNNGLETLEDNLGHNGSVIKSQTQSVVNYYPQTDDDMWFGDLTSLENEQGYLVNTTAACEFIYAGVAVNPSEHPITLVPNWTWIGYPVNIEQYPAEAMSGFVPTQNDIVKGQNSFALYYDGWFPQDFVMIPGQSYKYQSKSDENRTLTFVNSGNRAEMNRENRYWKSNEHAFADNMNIIATVYVADIEQYDADLELGAFVNGVCRGSAKLKYFEPLNRYYAMLTISGDKAEDLEFALVNAEQNMMGNSSEESLTFAADAVIGSFDEPFEIHFGEMTDIDRSSLVIYPNPVDRNETFTLDIPKDETIKEIIITDALGSVVCKNTRGLHVSGIYMVKAISVSGNVYNGKLVVK